jgi:catechol 2,3-dioxygenase-like lactoylglutathione lyase family enzyme
MIAMHPRIDLITLGVPDLDEARRFYLDGLGWEPVLEVAGEVSFIQVGHGRVLALFGADDLVDDIGGGPAADAPRGAGVTLAQIVDAVPEVAEAMARAEAAGATVLKPAQDASWGGHHGYFADPSGFVWEIAYNPGFRVDAEGRVRMGAVE